MSTVDVDVVVVEREVEDVDQLVDDELLELVDAEEVLVLEVDVELVDKVEVEVEDVFELLVDELLELDVVESVVLLELDEDEDVVVV